MSYLRIQLYENDYLIYFDYFIKHKQLKRKTTDESQFRNLIQLVLQNSQCKEVTSAYEIYSLLKISLLFNFVDI